MTTSLWLDLYPPASRPDAREGEPWRRGRPVILPLLPSGSRGPELPASGPVRFKCSSEAQQLSWEPRLASPPPQEQGSEIQRSCPAGAQAGDQALGLGLGEMPP